MSSTALRGRTRLAMFNHTTGVLFNDTPVIWRARPEERSRRDQAPMPSRRVDERKEGSDAQRGEEYLAVGMHISSFVMFRMSTFRKGREVGVADVFHVLVDTRRGSIVTVDRHLFQQSEEPFQIGLGILFVGRGSP